MEIVEDRLTTYVSAKSSTISFSTSKPSAGLFCPADPSPPLGPTSQEQLIHCAQEPRGRSPRISVALISSSQRYCSTCTLATTPSPRSKPQPFFSPPSMRRARIAHAAAVTKKPKSCPYPKSPILRHPVPRPHPYLRCRTPRARSRRTARCGPPRLCPKTTVGPCMTAAAPPRCLCPRLSAGQRPRPHQRPHSLLPRRLFSSHIHNGVHRRVAVASHPHSLSVSLLLW